MIGVESSIVKLRLLKLKWNLLDTWYSFIDFAKAVVEWQLYHVARFINYCRTVEFDDRTDAFEETFDIVQTGLLTIFAALLALVFAAQIAIHNGWCPQCR